MNTFVRVGSDGDGILGCRWDYRAGGSMLTWLHDPIPSGHASQPCLPTASFGARRSRNRPCPLPHCPRPVPSHLRCYKLREWVKHVEKRCIIFSSPSKIATILSPSPCCGCLKCCWWSRTAQLSLPALSMLGWVTSVGLNLPNINPCSFYLFYDFMSKG